jgi:hypothetical protein
MTSFNDHDLLENWFKNVNEYAIATSFMSDLDDVNFPVTVANCVSPFGCHLNSIGVT